MNWTDDRTEILKKLWANGLSARRIAAELGGITRNSVIGKIHRMERNGKRRTEGREVRISPWKNPRAIELLERFHAEGRSWQQIANAITAEGIEVSRDAVRGRIARTRLNGKAPETPRSVLPQKPGNIVGALFSGYRPGRQLPVPRKKAAVTAIATVPAESFRCTLLDLTNESCRWPIGDPWKPNFRFCGAPGADFPARPYCQCHQRMGWARAAA